jgi:hypothetical protein
VFPVKIWCDSDAIPLRFKRFPVGFLICPMVSNVSNEVSNVSNEVSDVSDVSNVSNR